jgi:hypothetical protein
VKKLKRARCTTLALEVKLSVLSPRSVVADFFHHLQKILIMNVLLERIIRRNPEGVGEIVCDYEDKARPEK